MTADGAIPTTLTPEYDAPSFEAVMRRHQPRVFALAARLTGSIEDAQEVVQDAFLRLHNHRGTIREDATRAWLRAVTVNLCRDRARHKLRWPRGEMPEAASAASSPERLAAEVEREQLLRDALQGLTERERTALVLRELEGLTTAEVAVHLGIAEATVRVQIMQARLKLRKLLAGPGTKESV